MSKSEVESISNGLERCTLLLKDVLNPQVTTKQAPTGAKVKKIAPVRRTTAHAKHAATRTNNSNANLTKQKPKKKMREAQQNKLGPSRTKLPESTRRHPESHCHQLLYQHPSKKTR